MQNALIQVVADWAVAGMAASYKGQKSFTMNVFEGEEESAINDLAHERARQMIAAEGAWQPGDIQISCLSWGRVANQDIE